MHDSARALARKHNIEKAIDKLYTTQVQPHSSEQHFSKKKMRKRRKGASRNRLHRIASRKRAAHVPYTQTACMQDVALQWPIARNKCWLSAGFGSRRRPNGQWEFHSGLDMAAPRGTPVYAAADGVIEQAGRAGGYGNVVVIRHTAQVKTRYAHLSKIVVKEGTRVAQGEMVGKVGATGNVRGKNGVHLHFEVCIANKRVNPVYFLS